MPGSACVSLLSLSYSYFLGATDLVFAYSNFAVRVERKEEKDAATVLSSGGGFTFTAGHLERPAACTCDAGGVDYTANYFCECAEFRRRAFGVYDFGQFDWMWCVLSLFGVRVGAMRWTLDARADRIVWQMYNSHRYSESRPDVKDQAVWRILSRNRSHLSRWNEFRHTEYCKRCKVPSLV